MSKNTLLIVDDERFFCTLLQDILEDNYQIITACNASETMQALDEQTIDLILLDVMMPKTDGYQLCQQIKNTEQYYSIPIIFLTAKNDTSNEIRGLNLGAVDYITKPVSPPIVQARVATHIALAKANQELLLHTQNLERLVSQRTIELSNEIAEKQKVYEKLHYLANYDQLTHLPNRNLFNERLAYTHKLAERNNSLFALLLIDLDRFKQVNDSLGHHIGDILLEQVGQRLSSCLRDVDSIARLGGDEFTVTLTELQNKTDAAIVATKIITELSSPFEIHQQRINIGSSIGITCYPDDSKDLDNMLINADMAMYEVKAKGKNSYTFFSSEMAIQANNGRQLEKDLLQAINDNSLYLHYQPIINLQTNTTFGVEALLRWRHPEHGQIATNKIISTAERSDLIFTLGEWILDTACQQIRAWQDQGINSIHIAVNMSPHQFNNKHNCIELIKRLIQQYNIPQHSLQLEITENLMLENSKLTLDTLHELKNLGVLLSVDDFGTGYSSLSCLRHFPVNILKIDHSFIKNIGLDSTDEDLIKTIISMGKNLNLKVSAEGVETKEQLTFLHAHQCDYAQGYYFSKPASATETATLLQAE